MKKFLAVALAVSMVLVFFAVRPVSVSAAGFPDVPANYWAKKQIDYLVSKGVIKGFPNGKFEPEAKVTREQFAKMIVVAKGLKPYEPATPSFTDVSKSRWSYGYVEAAARAGYIKGYGNGKFGPADPITREQLAVLEIRVLGKEKEANDPNLIFATFSNDESQVDSWAKGAMTLAVRPHYQLLKWDDERNIRPRDPATRAECAYSIYMILKPPVDGGSIAEATAEQPKTLFGGLDSSATMYEILGPMAETAAGETPTGTLYPVEAKYVPSQADGTWIVNKDGTMKTVWKLRKGIKWADGQPVTAQDYVFSWKMSMSDKVNFVTKDPMNKIAKIETPDDYTIVVYWKNPTIWAQTGVTGAGVYPAHILKPIFDKNPSDINSCDYNTKPVYNGPYELSAWSTGNYIILKKNPNYWAGQGLINSFIFYFTPDTNTMLMQLMAGKIDVTMPGIGISAAQAAAAKKNGLTKTFNIYYIPATYWEHVTLNLNDPILKDINLRKALMYALDRKEMSNKIDLGTRTVCYGPQIPGTASFNTANVGKYPYDPAKAREILKNAGYTWDKDGNLINPDGKKVTINIEYNTGNEERANEIAFMQQYWKKNLGVTVTATPKSWGKLIDDWYAGTFQGALFAWGSDPMEICDWTLYNSKQIPTKANGENGQNFTRISDPELDKWTEMCNDSVDPKVRIEASKHVQAIVYDKLPELYLDIYTSIAIVRKGLVGFDYKLNATVPSSWNAQYWYWEK